MKKLIILCLIFLPITIFGEAISGRWEFSAGKTRNAKELYTLEVINSFTATISLSTETSKSPLLIILDKDNNIVDSISSNGYVQTSSNLELDKTPYKIIATTANVGDTADYTLSVNGGSGNFSLYKRAADTIVKPFIIGDFMGAQFSQNSNYATDFNTIQKYKDCGFNTLGIGIQEYNLDWPLKDITTMKKSVEYRGDIANAHGLYVFAYDNRKRDNFSASSKYSSTWKKLNLYKNLDEKYRDNMLGYFLRDEPHPRHFDLRSPNLKKKSHYFSHDSKKLVYVNLHHFNNHTVHPDTALKLYSLPDSVYTGKDENGLPEYSYEYDDRIKYVKTKFFNSQSFDRLWNLYEEYVHNYFYNSDANVISFDLYPINGTGYSMNKDIYCYFKTLNLFAQAAKETEKEFWIINYAFHHYTRGYPTKKSMRYETNTALLHGIKGINWFSYEMTKDANGDYKLKSQYLDFAAKNTDIYNSLQTVNSETIKFGNLRMKLKWDKVIHGSTYDPETFVQGKVNIPLETQFLEDGQPITLQGNDAQYFALGRFIDYNNIPYYYVMNKRHDANRNYSVTIPVYGKDVFYYDMSTETFKPLSEHSSYYHNGNSVTISVPPAEIVVLKIGKSINVAPIFNQLLAN